MNTIIDALNWRYATKKFDPTKKISSADLDTILESLRLSPSSYGLQPWKFIVVKDEHTRAELRKSAWNQSQITDASDLIILCQFETMTSSHIDSYFESMAKTTGQAPEKLVGYKKMIQDSVNSISDEKAGAWMKQQVYIALGVATTTAAVLGIDSCPMEGFDNASFDLILGLQELGLKSAVLLPIGYRTADDAQASLKKTRFGINEVVIVK
jgi:nitroreductase